MKAKPKIPVAAYAVAAVVVGVGLAAYLFSGNDKKEGGFTPGVSQIEPAQNASTQRVIDKPVESSGPAANPEPKAVTRQPEPVLIAKNDATLTPIKTAPVAAVPMPSVKSQPTAAPISAAGIDPGSKLAQTIQLANEKAKVADAARQQLAAIQQAEAEKAKARQAADAGVKEVQSAAQEKIAAAETARKAASEAAAAQKQHEDAQKKAETDAEEAQKAAADKARLAVEARKSVVESAQAVKQQQALAQRADAEAQELQRLVTEKVRVAGDVTRAAAAGEAARKQAELAVQQAEADAAAARAEADRQRMAEQTRKAADEAERIRMTRESELRKIAEQATVAAKAAADAQKALQEAQRQLEEAQKARERASQQAADAAKAGAVPPPVEPTLPSSSPSAMVAPGAPALAMNTQKNPSLTVGVPKAKIEQTLENTLGMKFAPVGGVLFSVWLTRTQDYNAFAKAAAVKSSAWMQPGFKQGPDHPVVNVSWNDAMSFCKWLTEKERKEGLLSATQAYRLPTDLEWSKAVGLPEETGRTPETRDMDLPDQYPWGTQWPPPQGAGNYTGEETGSDVAIKGYDDGFAWTSPVGTFPPNKAGLYDMGGNVWQWCMDWYNDEHKQKVLRGGSWYNGALKLSLLSSSRDRFAPDKYTDNYGFRVVIAADSTAKPGRH